MKPSRKKVQNLTDNKSYPNILKLDSCFWATELKYRFGNKAIFFDVFVCFLFGSINNLNIFHGQPQRLVLKDLCSLVPTVRKIFMFPNIVLGISCLILIDCFKQVDFLESDINFHPLCHKWYFVTKIVLTYCEKKCWDCQLRCEVFKISSTLSSNRIST